MDLAKRHTKILAAYGLILGVTWLLVAMSIRTRALELLVAGVLQLLVGLVIWTWSPSRPSTRRFILASTGLVISVALMRDASGSDSGVSVLDLLPLMLAAGRANRRELVWAWMVSAVALYLPELVIGAPRYPAVALRGVSLLLLVGIVVGATVLRLVSELSTEKERERELTEEARTQLATEDALRQVATLVAAGAPATELFSEVSRQLATIAGASMGAVVRFSDDLAIGEMVGAWRADRRVLSGRKVDLHRDTAAARVRQTGRPIILHNPPAEEGIDGATAAVAAPIFVRGRLWGSASAAFKPDEVIPVDIQGRFERFAELVAMAISNAENVSQLVEHATIDALTGIPNRRSFDQALTVEIERAARREHPLSVILLDVDHFKAVNDNFGHQTGDVVLAGVARALADEARSGELVARLGGEEFVWLMPTTTAEEAVVAAERARAAVAAVEFDLVGHVTLSAGVNSNLRDDTERQMLSGADEALYAAKSRGRDQTVAASAALSSAEDRVKPAAA
jgi:diguanylate cyclase (GGDEF)-like protein